MTSSDKVLQEYHQFDPVTDAFFFKVGGQGQVIFHGRNYIIKKRLTSQEISALISQPHFVRAASNIHVNVNKITSFEGNVLHFRDDFAYPRTISVSKRVLEQIKKRMSSPLTDLTLKK